MRLRLVLLGMLAAVLVGCGSSSEVADEAALRAKAASLTDQGALRVARGA